jgi:hypothetical protein
LSRKLPEGTYIPSRRERDRDTLRSEPQISSEEIAPFHAKVLQEVAEFEGTFEVQRNKAQEEEHLLEYRREPRLQAS